MALVLFGTDGCHLCEDAQALLLSLPVALTCDLYVEDIASSEALVERYGLLIPILKSEETQAELHWPFDSAKLLSWLAQQGCLDSRP